MNSRHPPDQLLAQAAMTVRRRRLFAPDALLIVAVSGGLDSMVMLHVLSRLGCRIEVAHFDHGTREGESAADADFVRETCLTLNVPFHTKREAVDSDAARRGRSFEAYARERRYAFLVDVARQRGAAAVAVAHHMNDQAETMLMAALGLSSDFGLNGIAPEIELDGMRVVRPMLDCSREDMEAWARVNAIPWRDDRTNNEACCLRNRMRLEALPFLANYSPHASAALARLADILRSDGAYLDAAAAQCLEAWSRTNTDESVFFDIDRTSFMKAPEAMRRRALKVLAMRLGVSMGHAHILRAEQFLLEAASGKAFDFGGGVVCRVAMNSIFILKPRTKTGAVDDHRVELPIPGAVPFSHGLVAARVHEAAPLSVDDLRRRCTPTRQFFDLDRIVRPVFVRGRRPGDRMVPFGLNHAKKVQDILVDEGIPAHRRDAIPLLAAGDEILWLVGVRRGAAAPVLPGVRRLLELTYEETHNCCLGKETS